MNNETPKPIGTVEYDTQALLRLMTQFGVSASQVMACNSQTNSNPVKHWINGKSPATTSLCNICTHLQFNILDFILYDGVNLHTHMENIYRMEKAGLDLRAYLRANGIDPYEPSPNHRFGIQNSLPSRSDVDAEMERLQRLHRDQRSQTETFMNQMLNIDDYINRIAEIQEASHRHESEAIAKIKAEHKNETDQLYQQIGYLKAQLNAEQEKNRQLQSANGFRTTLHAADDSKIDYQPNK